jgi:4-amino-4-deoxy-L-arabinose transferase-like glycosyltransferase
MAEGAAGDEAGAGGPEPVPWRPVLGLAGAVVLVLLAVSTRYGWHRDELYFLEAGKHHLAWGYIDQPPFTPFVARLADAVAPGNLTVLRLLPALVAALDIVLAALIGRELGARRTGQVACAGAMAACGFAVGVSHLLSTASFDLAAWMALVWCACRLLRTGEPRWWLAFGAIAGTAMLNKDLVPLLAVALVIGLAIERRWDLLRTPWLVAGGVLALAVASPNLIWQAQHGWPQQDMARALAERLAGENRTTLLPLQLLFSGPLLIPVLWAGARTLATAAWARRFRTLLWTWIAAVVLCLATAGRPYYVLPLTQAVLLVGIVAWAREGRARVLAKVLVPSAAVTLVLALPVLPLRRAEIAGAVNEATVETIGWPELADQVADVVRSLPAPDQGHVVLLTGTYGEAGALARYGPSRGLPRPYSGHNSYADFGVPTDDHAVVVAVRIAPRELARWFEHCAIRERVDNGLGIDNEVQGTPITICRGQRTPWSEIWPDLRFLS